jgi:hypothetical protein
MSEDLGEEDIVGLVFGFELVATDGAVGASQVAGFPRQVEGAEGGGNVLWELGAGGGVNGIRGREAFEIAESLKGLNKFLWVGEDGDWVRLEAGTGSLTGFELAVEDKSGKGEFLIARKPQITMVARSKAPSRRDLDRLVKHCWERALGICLATHWLAIAGSRCATVSIEFQSCYRLHCLPSGRAVITASDAGSIDSLDAQYPGAKRKTVVAL